MRIPQSSLAYLRTLAYPPPPPLAPAHAHAHSCPPSSTLVQPQNQLALARRLTQQMKEAQSGRMWMYDLIILFLGIANGAILYSLMCDLVVYLQHLHLHRRRRKASAATTASASASSTTPSFSPSVLSPMPMLLPSDRCTNNVLQHWAMHMPEGALGRGRDVEKDLDAQEEAEGHMSAKLIVVVEQFD